MQRFTITFGHRELPATQIRIGLSMPDRNAERFFALVRERLEHTELPAPTIVLSLSADQFAMPTALQTDLLSGAAAAKRRARAHASIGLPRAWAKTTFMD